MYVKIEEFARLLGGSEMPRSCGGADMTREDLEIDLGKTGNGVRLIYARSDEKCREVDNLPDKFRALFPGSLSLVFETTPGPSDVELTQRLVHITESWHMTDNKGNGVYGSSWNGRLTARPWRTEEGGEIYAEVLNTGTVWNGNRRIPQVPTTNRRDLPRVCGTWGLGNRRIPQVHTTDR
jgi:hypothetical protein